MRTRAWFAATAQRSAGVQLLWFRRGATVVTVNDRNEVVTTWKDPRASVTPRLGTEVLVCAGEHAATAVITDVWPRGWVSIETKNGEIPITPDEQTKVEVLLDLEDVAATDVSTTRPARKSSRRKPARSLRGMRGDQ